MNGFSRLFRSSLGKKYLMALSGIILTGFVLGHMIGNLQFFLPPDWINTYAYHLQNMPYGSLWLVRLILLASIVIHVWTGIVLAKQNRAARPGYALENTREATLASRTMIWTGLIILAFIIFHILHYTTKNVYDYNSLHNYRLDGIREPVLDVHTMMYLGFSKWYVSLFYIIATGLLMMHLTHGVSSMFQSLGLRNEVWRPRLRALALAYGWIVFLGFASIPLYVLLHYYAGFDPFGITTPAIQSYVEGSFPVVTR